MDFQTNKFVRYQIVGFLISGIFSIYIGFIAINAQAAGDAFIEFGYWLVLSLFIIWCHSIYKAYHADFIAWFKERSNLLVIIASVLAALFLYTREGGGFKIIFDEYMLSNTALNMHRDRLPVVSETSLQEVQMISAIDKRPLLFPLILSLIHDVTGYRVVNAFYLNLALTVVLFTLQFALLEKLFGKATARIGFILLIFTPLIEQNSSGGGFELLNIVCLLACILVAIFYWKNPTEARLNALLLTFVILANVRYESAVFIFPVAILVLGSWIRLGKIRATWTSIILPLLFIPLAWQFRYVLASPGFWQFKLEGSQSFSLSYLAENVKHASKFLFNYSPNYPNTPVIGIIGCLSLLALICICCSRSKPSMLLKGENRVFYLFSTFIIIHLFLILAFTYGQLDDPLVSRLALPFIVLLVAAISIFLGYIWMHRERLRFVVHIVIILAITSALPLYAQRKYSKANPMSQRIHWILGHVNDKNETNALYISYASKAMELYHINNISFARARDRRQSIELHQKLGTYDNIYFVQSGIVELVEGEIQKNVFPGHQQPSNFVLETIDEISFFPYHFTRISRVSGYKEKPSGVHAIPRQPMELYRPINVKTYSTWERSLP